MKKRMISGIKPTGQLTLGNYIGALKPFAEMQDEYDISVFIANLHCITMPIEPEELSTNLRDALAFYIACGLNTEKTSIFLQTDVMEHAQLGFIMSCLTYMGELNRMTQYKDKKETETSLSAGFYTYPTLMSADILLHQVDYVPVGEDQKQHVELARDVALRFNQRYGNVFKIPEPVIPKVGSRIMSLQDPCKKMSKSDTAGSKGVIYLKDDLKQVRKKIMAAVTDSEAAVRYDVAKQPGIANLLTIYAALEGTTPQEVAEQFKDEQYGSFKKAVADRVCVELEAIQIRYHEIVKSDMLYKVLEDGAQRVQPQAHITLKKVQQVMGVDWR